MATVKKCCKTCRYWDINSAKSGKGRVISNRLAPCLYPIKKIILPESHHAFNMISFDKLRHMCADYGKYCDCWEKREDTIKSKKLEIRYDDETIRTINVDSRHNFISSSSYGFDSISMYHKAIKNNGAKIEIFAVVPSLISDTFLKELSDIAEEHIKLFRS